jgi:fermentation-respiration switch protein FrsA (DUF1100 family)
MIKLKERTKGLKIMLTQTIKVLFILFITLALLTYFFQRQLIYHPTNEKPRPEDFGAQGMEVVTLVTKDHLKLNAWYEPAKKNYPTVLFLHGNAGNIGYRMPIAKQLINAGFGVLLLDYRGYGGNPGSPNEQGLYMDGEAALHFLDTRGIAATRLVIYGESLGTGVATQLATEHASCAVVLQSPFTSLADAARYHYPWIPLKPWDKYNSLARIQQIHSPLLVLHGTIDNTVPYNEGLTLFQAALQPKKMISYLGYDHHNLWGEANFYNNTIQFIQHYCTSEFPKNPQSPH